MAPDAGRLFRSLDLPHQRKLIVAVSGGSDSLSLLFLLKTFLLAHAPATRLLAVTIDHGLRPDSAVEAEWVGELCRSRGVAHRILVWRGHKPKTGTIAAAREARYGLLARAAAEFGADCILTGHTMDDQAETVAMRERRGAGHGLSGMAADTLFDGKVWILRPLLGTRRQALRDYLDEVGVRWVDDPTNENRLYERVRARSALAGTDEVDVLAASAAEAGVARRRLSRASGLLIDRHASMPSPGLFRLDRALLAEDEDAAVHALRAVLATAGGTPYLPDHERTQALFERLSAVNAIRVPLSRAVVDARKSDIWIRRETRGLPEAAMLSSSLIWDGRWRVAVGTLPGALTIAPLGAERAAQSTEGVLSVPKSLARAALSLEPAVSGGDNAVTLAVEAGGGADGFSAERVVSPFARFLPGFDLALAGALARLAGAKPAPPSPWKDHIDA